MTQPWGSMPEAPPWRDPGPGRPAPPRVAKPVSGWAIAGLIVGVVGFVAAGIGASLALLALAGNGLIYAASTGDAGSADSFVEITRIGDLFVVLPLGVASAACSALAWRAWRVAGRSLGLTIASSAVSGCLVLLGLLTLLVFV